MPYSRYGVDISPKAKKARTVTDLHTGKTITFASATEKRYYDEYLIPAFRSGQIIDYDLQRHYSLIPAFDRQNGEHIRKIEYIADFWLKFSDGHVQVKDVKGASQLIDDVAKIKRKMMYYYYPNLDYEWICYYGNSWINWDDFMAKRRAAKREKKKKKT